MSEDTVGLQMLLSMTFSFLLSADFVTNFFSGVTFFSFWSFGENHRVTRSARGQSDDHMCVQGPFGKTKLGCLRFNFVLFFIY